MTLPDGPGGSASGTVLITGGTGMAGSALARHLVATPRRPEPGVVESPRPGCAGFGGIGR